MVRSPCDLVAERERKGSQKYKKLGFNTNNIQFRRAISVVGEYINIHNENKFKLNDNLSIAIENFVANNDIEEDKPQQFTIEEYFSYKEKNFKYEI